MKLEVIYDIDAGYWTGRPWLVINEEGEPAVESFRSEGDALDFIAEQAEDASDRTSGDS